MVDNWGLLVSGNSSVASISKLAAIDFRLITLKKEGANISKSLLMAQDFLISPDHQPAYFGIDNLPSLLGKK